MLIFKAAQLALRTALDLGMVISLLLSWDQGDFRTIKL